MLARRFKLAEKQNEIHGVSIAKKSPKISHLLFADDSLFFCKAEKKEIETVQRILQDYSEASGQLINLSKSSITYGHKIAEAKRDEIKAATGIQNVGGNGIYLGLPEVFIGFKVSTLKFLEDKVASKVNSWKTKYLSLAGKETLIKAGALALPTYSMSCFKFPKTSCKTITRMLAKFWWRNHKTEKGIHWIGWSRLTKSKAEGGLNFKNIHGFNLALLGKQIWRMASRPHSLLARTYKGR